MKSKELIKILQEEDPSGETEVVVGYHDILYVAALPGYYDGNYEILIRDEKGYVTGIKPTREGDKIKIIIAELESLLWDNPDLNIDLSDLKKHDYYYDHYQKEIARIKKDIEDYDQRYSEKD